MAKSDGDLLCMSAALSSVTIFQMILLKIAAEAKKSGSHRPIRARSNLPLRLLPRLLSEIKADDPAQVVRFPVASSGIRTVPRLEQIKMPDKILTPTFCGQNKFQRIHMCALAILPSVSSGLHELGPPFSSTNGAKPSLPVGGSFR